jgi:chromosome segregation ATPase
LHLDIDTEGAVMATDSIPLRRSVFGYRPHDVRQFLLEREEVMSEVERRMQDAHAKHANLEAYAGTLKADLDRTRKDVAALRDALSHKDEEIASLGEALRRKDEEVLPLREALRRESEQVASLREDLQRDSGDLAALRDTLVRKDEELAALQAATHAASTVQQPNDLSLDYVWDQAGRVIERAEEATRRILHRANETLNRQLEELAQTRASIATEMEELAGWRESARALRDATKGARLAIGEVPSRFRDALDPIQRSMTELHEQLEHLESMYATKGQAAPGEAPGRSEGSPQVSPVLQISEHPRDRSGWLPDSGSGHERDRTKAP